MDVPRHDVMRGVLLQSDGPVFDGRVFYVADGVRHYVPDAEWITSHGFRWPEDVNKVTDEELGLLRAGRPISRDWTEADRAAPPRHSRSVMREVAASFLEGEGIEIGAGANPLPIPVRCSVTYADRFGYRELLQKRYPGQTVEDIVEPTFRTDFEDLNAIPPNSVDFIASAHVIEHVPDPVGAIVRAAAKIRPGGHHLLVVPDMTQTFDRDRALTTLDHLLLDLCHPSRERDREHFQEFYAKAFVTPAEAYERTWTQNWENRFPIHYHTWTYESFREMVDWIIGTLNCYCSYWSQPMVENEFYFVLHRLNHSHHGLNRYLEQTASAITKTIPRKQKILSGIDVQYSVGLEIGPLATPIVTKEEGQIFYVDYASKDNLIKKYADDPAVNVEQIVDVDAIWGTNSLKACFPEELHFDYVIASHVLEHVPDMIGWLHEVKEVLCTGGRLCLALPDKRFTFDYLRRQTTVADLIESNLRKSRSPSPGQIFDFITKYRSVDLAAAWEGTIQGGTLTGGTSPDLVLAAVRDAVSRNEYIDVHCWVFTAHGLLEMFSELALMGLMPFKPGKYFPIEKGTHEFILVLEESGTSNLREIATSFSEVAEEARRANPQPTPVV